MGNCLKSPQSVNTGPISNINSNPSTTPSTRPSTTTTGLCLSLVFYFVFLGFFWMFYMFFYGINSIYSIPFFLSFFFLIAHTFDIGTSVCGFNFICVYVIFVIINL